VGESIGRRFDRRSGWLGGICAGIGRYFNVDAIYVRIAVVVAAVFFPKIVIAAYIIAWFLLYRRDQP
jgi:phage shock protein PspC (stress-responsive transcriptional regulator)